MRIRFRFLLPFLLGLTLVTSAVAAPFGTLREGGVWWLTLPGGPRFFSVGADTVNGGDKMTRDRGYYFENTYPTEAAWAADTQERLYAWGFNTRGGWSDPTTAMTLPLVPEIDLGRNARLHWFDPFAPDALEKTIAKAREVTAPYRDNPAVIGYFTDNEVGWWNAPLFKWYLGNEWAIYAKRHVWRMVYDHYGGKWDRLLADFVPAPGFDSFEDLKKGRSELKLRPGGRGILLINKVTAACAGRYYELVYKALRAVDPTRLVMGDRLPLYYNQDAVLASRGFLDVLSTNYNVDTPDGWVAPYYFEGLGRLTDTPVLISEFFFAADENRSGNVNNGHLMHVATQAERAAGASAAVRHFAAFPNIAGIHWFQYYDEPHGGRGDGEDFNMGLVDVHNVPYEQLLAAMVPANREAPAIHAASAKPPVPQPEVIAIPAAAKPVSVTDGGLADWPDKAGTRLPWLRVPAPHVPFGDVHMSWSPQGLNLFHLAQNYADLFLLAYDGEFPITETYQLQFEVDAGAGLRRFAACLLPRPHSKYPGRFELVPRLFRIEDDGRLTPIEDGGLVQVLDKPLPHIAMEMRLPAALLGVKALTPGQGLTLRLRATTFYREMTMTLGGVPQGRGTVKTDRPVKAILSD
ncbi:hypothetical protein GTA51_10615 [Desulfovibrio aerotolerans]|uniref:Glycoside hydrolase family 42 N-terminal domain-containing protein n=1 Tax=Solidesulfovibrio aerotolerans TaxID=295255 RepID=A0A7C9NJV5_9BACT|nr:hypothetical protein [Solidesulfovibrio aerotolerans]MYL83576.1 hypothetical protein [Solidesulfovibrio aerotolerans]